MAQFTSVFRWQHGWRDLVGWGGRLIRGGLVRELLPAFFFLFGLLCQIALAFFELVVGLGQENSFVIGGGDGGIVRRAVIEDAHSEFSS